MNKYFDLSFFQNPLTNYLKWIFTKMYYQIKYFGKHLRLGYLNRVKNVKFGKYNWTGIEVTLINSNVGDFTYFSDGCVILETTLGNFCSIGPNVRTSPGKHPTSVIVATHPAIYSNPGYCLKNFAKVNKHVQKRNVIIGNDVWLCANAVISDGISIGDGAIVAANSVVVKDVEPYSIVSGIPAKHIRYRFTEDERSMLLKTRWWDRDLEWIETNASLLWDIEEFMKKIK